MALSLSAPAQCRGLAVGCRHPRAPAAASRGVTCSSSSALPTEGPSSPVTATRAEGVLSSAATIPRRATLGGAAGAAALALLPHGLAAPMAASADEALTDSWDLVRAHFVSYWPGGELGDVASFKPTSDKGRGLGGDLTWGGGAGQSGEPEAMRAVSRPGTAGCSSGILAISLGARAHRHQPSIRQPGL